ncbi:LysR family transcriptional regulator [Sphingomonas floccifaciens]|uniref:LysR family transcriptional regulator n=1 Tax=Sphingomonas floccifaciens TaxID=1844115 RepID=A0ABW4N9R5_9SPHN
MQNMVPSQRPVRDFTPVPRKYRYDGWTADRQRAFVAALAETGSVTAAARRINMSTEGAYYLRRQPGAEEFAAAWADALDHGVQSLADIAIDRAREGTPVPVFWKGEQIGEKRRYNDRLLMFILRHHMPGKYGALAALPTGTKHPDTIAREKKEAEKAERLARQNDEAENKRLLGELLKQYEAKVIQERRYRLEGKFVAADQALRTLAFLELVMVVGGESAALIDRCTGVDKRGMPLPDRPYSDPMSDLLAEIRQKVWDKIGDPPRPPVWLPRKDPGPHTELYGKSDRALAQQRATQMMAEAQALWEATATEEKWAKWCGGEEMDDGC